MGKARSYILREQLVRNCFEQAFEATFNHIEAKLQHPDKNSLLVVHGGSALQPLFREELVKRARNSPVTTRIMYNGGVETSQGGKFLRTDAEHEECYATTTHR
jgi:hypothetical protein